MTKDLLRRLRNDLPMPVTIAALGRELYFPQLSKLNLQRSFMP